MKGGKGTVPGGRVGAEGRGPERAGEGGGRVRGGARGSEEAG